MSKRHIHTIGNLESLFLRLEELVLANSGEDEFAEIFKLIIAKLWDERTEGEDRFYCYSNPQETHDAISKLLRDAEKSWFGILPLGAKPLLRAEHLDICVEAISQHHLSDNDLTVIDNFFEFLVSRTAKGAKGQYFTPRYVVEFCIRMLQPTEHDVVLDPACGSGSFLISTLNYVRAEGKLSTSKMLQNYCQNNLWGFDIDVRAIQIAKALMILAGDGKANIIQLNSLLTPEMASPDKFESVSEQEYPSTLTVEDVIRSRMRHHKGFDIIITNPPFAGEVREQQILERYVIAKGKNRIERDVLFLERCIQLLRPGGKLAIILPHNKFAAQSLRYIREWLFTKVNVLAVVGLGRNTFLPHTHQKANILFAQKRISDKSSEHIKEIFFAISERDGKNSKGQLVIHPNTQDELSNWERVDHDFHTIVEAFHKFRNQETGSIEQ